MRRRSLKLPREGFRSCIRSWSLEFWERVHAAALLFAWTTVRWRGKEPSSNIPGIVLAIRCRLWHCSTVICLHYRDWMTANDPESLPRRNPMPKRPNVSNGTYYVSACQTHRTLDIHQEILRSVHPRSEAQPQGNRSRASLSLLPSLPSPFSAIDRNTLLDDIHCSPPIQTCSFFI